MRLRFVNALCDVLCPALPHYKLQCFRYDTNSLLVSLSRSRVCSNPASFYTNVENIPLTLTKKTNEG
jgi:hypothetical protein